MHLFPKNQSQLIYLFFYILFIKGSSPDEVDITDEVTSSQHNISAANAITFGGNITSVSSNITENALSTNKELVTKIAEQQNVAHTTGKLLNQM